MVVSPSVITSYSIHYTKLYDGWPIRSPNGVRLLYERQSKGGAQLMNSFKLLIYDLSQQHEFDNVSSFVGRDSSGSFGLMAGHETFVTCLQPGLARFRQA